MPSPPEPEPDGDPYGDIDFQSFDNYLNDGAPARAKRKFSRNLHSKTSLPKPQR